MASTGSEESSGVGRGEPSRRGKNRPGKNERQRLRDSRDQQPTPVGAPRKALPPRDTAKQAAFGGSSHSGGDSGFTPGKYPVVFPSMPAEATIEHGFIPDVHKSFDHINDVWEGYEANDKFIEFQANFGSAGVTPGMDGFRASFFASAFAVFAQMLVLTHINCGYPQGDFGGVLNPDLPHSRAVRTIMSQYGAFTLDMVGQRWRIPAYSDLVKTIVILADKLIQTPPLSIEDMRATVEGWWLPFRRGDEKTKWILATKLSVLIRTHFPGLTSSPEHLVTVLFGGVVPAWWDLMKPTVCGATYPTDLDFLFAAFPATWQTFTGLFSNAGGIGGRRLTLLTLVYNDAVVTRIGSWTTHNHKSSSDKVVNEWARWLPTFKKYFLLSDKSTFKDVKGWPTQFSGVYSHAPVSVVRSHWMVGSGEFSLSACSPPLAMDTGLHSDVVVTTTTNLKMKSIEWLASDWVGG